ncbi:hypothetical protein, partial [Streptomyces beijiangensis]
AAAARRAGAGVRERPSLTQGSPPDSLVPDEAGLCTTCRRMNSSLTFWTVFILYSGHGSGIDCLDLANY